MAPIAKEPLARALIRGAVRHEARQAADNNEFVSRQEQSGRFVSKIIADSADSVREAQPGKWAHVDEITDVAMDRVRDVLGQVNQPSGRGHALLSAEEVRKAAAIDAEVGALLKFARTTQRRQKDGKPLYTEVYNVPPSWKPEVSVSTGNVELVNGKPELTTPTDLGESAPLVNAAINELWGRVLMFRERQGTVDMENNGTLRVGKYTDPETNLAYEVADWIDIDDASFTLYFQRKEEDLNLKIVQFSN